MKKHTWLLNMLSYRVKIIRCLLTSDYAYHMKKHRKKLNKISDFYNPVTLNEKIVHRMLFDTDPRYTRLADKVQARTFVTEKIGEKYLTNLLGVYEKFNQIDFSLLPDKFVIKCSHDSGSTVICKDKEKLDQKDLSRKINLCLAKNMYYRRREKHYRKIAPRIICEEYLDVFSHADSDIPPDIIRIHSFDGSPQFIEADFTDKQGKEYVNVYDPEWQLLPVTVGYPNLPVHSVRPPEPLRELLRLTTELSAAFDYCRIDWFVLGERIYFSEFTFTPCFGMIPFSPQSFDYKFGLLWKQQRYCN